MLRQRLLSGASVLCGGVKSSAPTVRCTPGVANASSLRVIAASIAALVRAIRRARPFLFRALCGVSPVSPRFA